MGRKIHKLKYHFEVYHTTIGFHILVYIYGKYYYTLTEFYSYDVYSKSKDTIKNIIMFFNPDILTFNPHKNFSITHFGF